MGKGLSALIWESNPADADAVDHPWTRRGGIWIAGLSGVLALALLSGVLGPAASLTSNLVYPVIAVGAGALLIAAAHPKEGRERMAWSLLGIGVILSGMGEIAWGWYEVLLGVEPPFPGVPDIFYLSAYLALAAGVFTMPRLAANPYERAQQVLDGIVVTLGISVVAWVTVLRPMYLAVEGSSLAELIVGGAYPLGDVLLVATVGTVGMKRSPRAWNRPLWAVVAALVVMAFGDLVYLTETWSDSYHSGSWVDATWAVSYGLVALAAAWLTRPTEPRDARDRRLPLWQLLVPVLVVLALSGLHIAGEIVAPDGPNLQFSIGLFVLGAIVFARILIAVAEDRYLVDMEKRQLVSVVSHELRTPLTAVQGYLDLLVEDWEGMNDGERREMAEVARDQSKLVTRIVTDLIATSRQSLHATDLKLEQVDLDGALEGIVRGMRVGVVGNYDLGSGALAMIDPQRLAQMVTNLATNADRYGGGVVEFTTRRVNGHVEIAVHDDGPGVPAKFQRSIWERFERGEHRFDETTPGSGLGLAIVRSLARAHGGEVGYRTSERLGGACFWIRLPVVKPARADREELGAAR